MFYRKIPFRTLAAGLPVGALLLAAPFSGYAHTAKLPPSCQHAGVVRNCCESAKEPRALAAPFPQMWVSKFLKFLIISFSH